MKSKRRTPKRRPPSAPSRRDVRHEVTPTEDEQPRLDALLRQRLGLSWRAARSKIERGKVFVMGQQTFDAGMRVDAKTEVALDEQARVLRPDYLLLPPEAMVFVDDDIAVVDKPAGLLTVPFKPSDRDTLDRLVRVVLTKRDLARGLARRPGGSPSFVVHRIDRGTSGLLVFARNRLALTRLKEQLRRHTALRRYVALVHGNVDGQTLRSHLVRDRGDGLRGSVERVPPTQRSKLSAGREAITHVEVLDRLRDATLVACVLETGRTNQIRIHLSELGHPLVGETVYRRDHGANVGQARRLCLHAGELGFDHPRTGKPLRFHSAVPESMRLEIDSRR